MSDEIREEFEKWDDNKEPYYINEACEKIHTGKYELLEIIDKISEDAFKAGRKSCDEEIKKLQDDRTELIANIRYFVNRVEAGTIRSKHTYTIYKNLLAAMDGDK